MHFAEKFKGNIKDAQSADRSIKRLCGKFMKKWFQLVLYQPCHHSTDQTIDEAQMRSS